MRCFGGKALAVAANQMWGEWWKEEGDPKVQLKWLGGGGISSCGQAKGAEKVQQVWAIQRVFKNRLYK